MAVMVAVVATAGRAKPRAKAAMVRLMIMGFSGFRTVCGFGPIDLRGLMRC